MTILILSVHTSPLAQPGVGDAGGMNVFIREISKALENLGHRVIIATQAHELTEPVRNLTGARNIPVIPVLADTTRPGLSKEDLADHLTGFTQHLIPAVEPYLRSDWGAEDEPLILYSHYWLSGVVAQHLRRTLADTRPELTVSHIHTMHTMAAVKNHAEPGSEPQHRVDAEASIVATADVLTANTEVEATELVTHYQADPERVQIVTPGVDHSLFTPDGPAHHPAEGTPALKVLFAGRLQPHKGPHILLEALAHLRQNPEPDVPLPHIHFSGAPSGLGGHAQNLPERAESLGVTEQVTFTQPSDTADLAALMRGADVVAMPSASESFGLVAAEAQACGTPVLAHRTGGLMTSVRDGYSGWLLPDLRPGTWAEALRRLSRMNAEQWHTYRAQAQQHAEQFQWNHSARRLLEAVAQS